MTAGGGAVARAMACALPALVMVVVMTIFSLYTVLVAHSIADGTNALVLAFLREVVAVSALVPYAYITERRKGALGKFWPARADVGEFVILGAAMVWAVQLLSALSLKHISATTYALLAPSVPVFTLIVSLVAGIEHFDRASRASWLKVAAIAITVSGALYIAVSAYAGSAVQPAGGTVIVGLLYLLTNKLAVGIYPILERALFARYATSVVVAWGYCSGAVLTFMSVATCVTDAAAWRVTPSGWGTILFAALFSSALNYSLMAWVNRRTSPLFVMAFYPLQSVATPVLAFFITGTPFVARDAGGGALVIAGLAVLIYARWLESHAAGHVQLADDAEKVVAGASDGGGAGKVVAVASDWLPAPSSPSTVVVNGVGREGGDGSATLTSRVS